MLQHFFPGTKAKESKEELAQRGSKVSSIHNTVDFPEKASSLSTHQESLEKTDIGPPSTLPNSHTNSQSNTPPLFHDLTSGRLVKLENFSFDDTPNHFNANIVNMPDEGQYEDGNDLQNQSATKFGE